MAPAPNSANLEKNAWSWVKSTEPGDVTFQNVLTAYRLNLQICVSCKKNHKGNPLCLAGLGEKEWLNGEVYLSNDSKKITKDPDSFVGLKNLGATCYANAFLQVWFHMPGIRRAILLWDLENNKTPTIRERSLIENVKSLQKVFALLNFSRKK
ncbi:hypothetical protein HELRODRAFT_182347 [Helobdella robusta]|uniref:USP domain-containing protein n=1 Tax=Helobdella robusta TaxID=6412 RepID=T1FI36_HELRO|nr:hypothetical protein HELRODRAFT_182347 [Helobdella robusta]ESN91002.1 hypothetical protein HELRODRAFT_182347 [Helobdella robusta]